jgi:nickel-dependent lactate racemase
MTNRRKFLQQGVVVFSTPRLIGTALSAGMFLPVAAASSKGSAKTVVIPTHEHFGDIEERLDFPASWDIHVQEMAGHNAPVLTRDEIRHRIQTPIASQPLREIAAGKKSAVITFDDCTRPTPTYDVAPVVVEELLAAGVPKDRIVFLCSYGTHRPMERDEVVRKLGPEVIRQYPWINHQIWENCKEVGTTSNKNRVEVDQTFAAADVRVTISGIKVHASAGYGGGAKAVLPGVASFQTIQFNHSNLIDRKSIPDTIRIFDNGMRADMVESAKLAKVDFSVQIVYNGRRKVCGIFAGDILDAHIAACRMAIKHYTTKKFPKPDIVVYNGYPQTVQAGMGGDWIRSVRDGGTGLVILQNPQGLAAWHQGIEHSLGQNGRTYLDRLLTQPAPLRNDVQLIVYSQYLDRQQMVKYPKSTIFASTWDEALRALQARHKGDASVAVYPYGAIQHSEYLLDEPQSAARG